MTLLLDHGKQFTSKFFKSACQLLKIANLFASTYDSRANWQVERYNRIQSVMMRCYDDHHHQDWDAVASTLTYAHNSQVHWSSNNRPFDLVLS